MSHVQLNTELIQINLNYLSEKNMTINQYLSLLKLYIYETEKRLLPIEVREEDVEWLVEQEYLNIKDDDVSFTEKGKDFFEPKEDLFYKFFELFPHKVPDGTGGFRVLGTSSPDTIYGNKMKRKWNSFTKGNIPLQERIIKALEYELEYRKKNASMTFMQNMDTWFNQGTWEKYIEDAERQQKFDEPKDKIL
jgi:hypothetical protein